MVVEPTLYANTQEFSCQRYDQKPWQGLPTSDAGDPTYRMQSFRQWLEHLSDDPSAANNLATLIAQAGAVGVSLDRLRKVVRLSPESLDEVLKGLLDSRQVMLLKVNGARVYRAT